METQFKSGDRAQPKAGAWDRSKLVVDVAPDGESMRFLYQSQFVPCKDYVKTFEAGSW